MPSDKMKTPKVHTGTAAKSGQVALQDMAEQNFPIIVVD